ncbi:MAG: hypothetical protein B5M53_10815, partial [Candidatus Cloacimonas sp. 4484_209]
MDKKMSFFHLLPLICPKCGAPITADSADRVYFCSNCGAASEFDGENLVLTETLYAKPIIDIEMHPEVFLPFWYFKLDISIKGKQVYLPFIFKENIVNSGNNLLADNELLDKIIEKQQYNKEKESDFIIYVPSFPTTGAIAYSSNLGIKFTKARPQLTYYATEKAMQSCIYNSKDALAIAEDEYISLQSRIIPNLLGLDLSFNLKEKKIIGIPY